MNKDEEEYLRFSGSNSEIEKKPSNDRIKKIGAWLLIFATGAVIGAAANKYDPIDKISKFASGITNQMENSKPNFAVSGDTIEVAAESGDSIWSIVNDAIDNGTITINGKHDIRDIVAYVRQLNKDQTLENGDLPVGAQVTLPKEIG